MAGSETLTGNNLTAALKMLDRVCTALEKTRVAYCLDAGTLLGVVRENRLLPWDTDLDVALPNPTTRQVWMVMVRLWLRGYRIRIKRYLRDDAPMRAGDLRIIKVYTRKNIFSRGPVVLDLFVKTQVEDRYEWVEGIKRYARKSVPANFHDDRTEIAFNGRYYSIPVDADGYLTHRYGDWKTPVKEWDHMVDDQAVISAKNSTNPAGE